MATIRRNDSQAGAGHMPALMQAAPPGLARSAGAAAADGSVRASPTGTPGWRQMREMRLMVISFASGWEVGGWFR